MAFQIHCWKCGNIFCIRCMHDQHVSLPGHQSKRTVPVCKTCFFKMMGHSFEEHVSWIALISPIRFPPIGICISYKFLYKIAESILPIYRSIFMYFNSYVLVFFFFEIYMQNVDLKRKMWPDLMKGSILS